MVLWPDWVTRSSLVWRPLQNRSARLRWLLIAAPLTMMLVLHQAIHVWALRTRASISVIMTADPGDMVGLSECKVIEEQLTNTRIERGQFFCNRMLHGTLYGQPVLLVTTGIGHDHASVCMSDLLRVFNGQLKEIFFLGTAGFSPRQGGILNPLSCGQDGALGGGPSDNALVTLGDVCISSWSTNWDCQKCVWSSEPTSGTVCRRPLCSMHGRDDLFGELVCNFWRSGSPLGNGLADEVYAAAGSAELPPLPQALLARVTAYWQTMARGTGKDYLRALRRTNRAFDYRVCSELTSNTFWSGAPYDYLGREYVARLTNRGMLQANASAIEADVNGEP